MKIPEKGSVYSVNEGYTHEWSAATFNYIQTKKDPHKGVPYGSRYVGSMVSDVHRTIKYGGIYLYPATTSETRGKLRLLYECNPMAYIVEKAGGKASVNPRTEVLDIVPDHIHQRCPIVIGSRKDVEEALTFMP